MKKRRANEAQLKRRRVKRERNRPMRMAWRVYLKKEVTYGTRNPCRTVQE